MQRTKSAEVHQIFEGYLVSTKSTLIVLVHISLQISGVHKIIFKKQLSGGLCLCTRARAFDCNVIQIRAHVTPVQIYCAHEYTQSNARFAISVEPGNAALQQRVQEVRQIKGGPSPS